MPEIASVLYGREDIRRRVDELGRTITADYEGREPVLLTVLRGGVWFLADLFRAVALPVAVDFMSITGYGAAEESLGRVRILKDLDRDIGGRDVIVVEDIVDTGLTLSFLMQTLRTRGARSVRLAALLDKWERREREVEINYLGFRIPDAFVVGYGLDFAERYRNLPYIAILKDPENG